MTPDLLDTADSLCLFVGWSRSGTSLVGSIINAHPQALVAHEADVLTLVHDGASKQDVVQAILDADASFARLGRRWNGYDYSIPGAADASGSVRVIGDKKAASTSEVLTIDPGALDRAGQV